METYPIEIADRHIIVLIGGERALLDTGSPLSMGNGRKLKVLGRKHTLQEHSIIDFSKLSKFVGTEITALMGCDILSRVYTAIEWDERRITFSDSPLDFGDVTVPVRIHYGLPLVDVQVGRRTCEVFFDTGARICFFRKEILRRRRVIGTIRDFHPLIGGFESPLHEIAISMADDKLTASAGVLPKKLEAHLSLAAVDGVVGNDLFRYYDVCMALPENQMRLRKKGGAAGADQAT